MNESRLPRGFDPLAYEGETRERWGDTEAYRQSQRRTAQYGDEEWAAAIAEGEDIAEHFAVVMRSGSDADAPGAVAVAEAHRRHIEHWFYDCSPEAHVGLGELYVTDQRFAEYWNEREAGLAEFVRAAIVANAGSNSVGQ